MRILFLGCGNMGGAIASGALKSLPEAQVTVVDPSPDRAREMLTSEGVAFHETLEAVRGEKFDVSVLAIKPQIFATLSAADCAALSSGVVVSIMAGVTLAGISAKLGTERLIRTMPNLPAMVGQGMTVGISGVGATAEDRDRVAALFDSVGDFTWLASEDQIDAVTAVAGSGPGYVFAFAHYMTKAAQAVGLDPELSDRLVRQTFLGAACLLKSDSRSAFALKEAVTSKAGTTEAGLKVFERASGFPQLCTEAVEAARTRSTELARS